MNLVREREFAVNVSHIISGVMSCPDVSSPQNMNAPTTGQSRILSAFIKSVKVYWIVTIKNKRFVKKIFI
jgi:hypothetical protein